MQNLKFSVGTNFNF